MPDRANKYNKLHINLLERYITPTLESFFTEEVLHNNIDFGPDLMEGDGSKIADPEIFLERKERKRLRKLIGNFKDVLQSKPGKTKSTCIEIKTGDAYPIHMTAYRVAPRRLPLLEEEIKTLLREGIIEPSNSQWAFPAILVPKPGGAVTLCIDYRKLNKVTIPDKFPIPLIDDLVDRLGHSKVISVLDLAKGYYQAPVHANSVDKTAFVTPLGKYCFTVLPFGLTGGPSVFQRLMNTVLAGKVDHGSAYIDDIAIFSNSVEEHFQHLEGVLEKLREHGLTAKPVKCKLFRKKCEYLGYLVGGGEVQPLAPKVQVIKDYLKPNTKHQLRAFLGLSNYYRRFIPGYAGTAKPLHNALMKKEPEKLSWTSQMEKAFTSLKNSLSDNPVLLAPNLLKPFTLCTDASGVGLGAVLSQEDHNGLDRPVAYYSRGLTKAEKNYSTTELECLAVVAAVKRFANYLESLPFNVITDHRSLLYLDKMKHSMSSLTRWSLSLQPFVFNVIHRAGSMHGNADGLSRMISTVKETKEDEGKNVVNNNI